VGITGNTGRVAGRASGSIGVYSRVTGNTGEGNWGITGSTGGYWEGYQEHLGVTGITGAVIRRLLGALEVTGQLLGTPEHSTSN